MYPEIAYSISMQLILAVIAFVTSYVYPYLIANLISQLFGENPTRKQKSLFAFLIGIILNQIWVYSFVFISENEPFSVLLYAIVVTPNPVFAIFYYIIGVKVLKLSPQRSIKLMGHVFLYYVLIKSLNRFMGSVFFIQPPGRYNYMIDVFKQLTFMAVFFGIYFATKYFLERSKQAIKLKDSLFVNFKRELLLYFSRAVVIYLLMVCLPMFFEEKAAANFVVFVVLVLLFIVNILLDVNQATKNYGETRDVYINALSRDFLMESEENISKLRKKINDNPSLISILLNKYDYAEKQKIKMRIALRGNIKNFNIDNIDVCKVISCLLDNAIDAAANCEHKWVYFTIESEERNRKLIVANNSLETNFDINKEVLYRQNENLSRISKIVQKYGNCTFQISYNTNEMLAYFEIKHNHERQSLFANISI